MDSSNRRLVLVDVKQTNFPANCGLDTDNLELSFLEQANVHIQRLTEKLRAEEDEQIKPCSHQLFRTNPYEEIRSSERQRLDQKLEQALIVLGNHIDTHNSVKVIDKKKAANYEYDTNGIIRLTLKENIKWVKCSTNRTYLMLHVIAKVVDLLRNNTHMTSRELFYNTQDTCRFNSKRLAAAVDDLSCLLGCSRAHLRIISQSKGIIYGDLKFELKNGEIFDCLATKDGMKIPSPVIPIVKISSGAKFLLIIEKDSVLQKILVQEECSRFIEEYKPIIFTARGYPDINSRAFLSFLWSRLKIPFFMLTDADPYGVEIASCYKFGCYSAAGEASYLAMPHIRWLGLLPSDVVKHPIKEYKRLSLSDHDRDKIRSLLKRPYLKTREDWCYQIRLMDQTGQKAELEAIDTQGNYLTQTYLPNKLRYKSWI